MSPASAPPSPPPTRQRQHAAWDAALKPTQRRAELGRARLQERERAEARRLRLIAAWLRELAERD